MVSSRPRRSAAPSSYQIAFPDLSSASSEGEDDSDDGSGGDNDESAQSKNNIESGANGSASASKKSKKKRKQPSPSPEDEPDSASGSEFEPEVVKDKDGKVVEQAEDSDDFEEDLAEESESGDSAEGEKDLDGISIAESDLLEDQGLLGGGGQGLKHGRVRYAGDASEDTGILYPSGPAPVRIVGRALLSTAGTVPGPKKGASRKSIKSHLTGSAKKLRLHELTYGPCFWPPPFVLTKLFDDPVHIPSNGFEQESATSGIQSLPPFSEEQKMSLLKRIAYLPFGPTLGSVIDTSWYKGKWIAQDNEVVRSSRWGGWYDSLPIISTAFEIVDDINRIMPYLPRNAYPPVPSNLHLECKDGDQDEKLEDNDDDAWDGQNTLDGPPLETGNAADVFRSNASDLHGRVRSAQDKQDASNYNIEDDGIVRFLAGPSYVNGQYQIPQKPIEMERLTSLRLDSMLTNKPGYVLNAGGPVWGLDWCPQADDIAPAFSTVSEQPSLIYRVDSAHNAKASLIQIWHIDTQDPADVSPSTEKGTKDCKPRLDLALLTEDEIMQLQWCPKGGLKETSSLDTQQSSSSLQRLGLLACLCLDRVIRIYDIPTPQSARGMAGVAHDDLVFLKREKALLTLDMGKIPVNCFDWASHERIVVGTTTGHVAVFDVNDALSRNLSKVNAIAIHAAHECSVTAISALRQPPLDMAGGSILNEESPRIATTSLDGSCKMTDLRDGACIFDFGHERATRNALAYQPLSDTLLFVDQDLGHRFSVLKGREFGTTTRIVSQTGPVGHIGVSDFHSFYAVASADGSCAVSNVIRRGKRGGHAIHYLSRLFRTDFDRKTGTYRFLDNILPDERFSLEGKQASRAKKGANTARNTTDAMPSFVWPPEVAVNRVAWSHSIRRAHMLSSGLACGLVRIDFVPGYWTAEASLNTRVAGFDAVAGDDSD